LPFTVRTLEKHPLSTQLFVPLGAERYVVVVALGDAAPDLSTLSAFLASGKQGITYHPGVWHHTLMALDQPTDFSCLVWEDGGRDDCSVHELAAADFRCVDA
jgi:ureidoglycolate lyase